MKRFNENELSKMIPEITAAQKVTMAFYNGNAWQEGAGWVGPRLAPTDPSAGLMMSEVARMFVSQNVIKEIIDREVSGLVGIPPDWSVSLIRDLDEEEEPTAEEQERIDLAQAWLRRWWAGNQGLVSTEDQLWSPAKILKQALATGLQIGRAPLRIFLPVDRWIGGDDDAGEATGIGGAVIERVGNDDEVDAVALGQVAEVTLPTLEPDEALESVFVHLPAPEQAEVHIDHSTLRIVGIYVASIEGGQVRDYELHSLEKGMAVVQKYVNGIFQSESHINLNNHPLMYEIGMHEMIDDSLRGQQRMLNMILTMMGRNSVQAGFLERIILNGQLPGRDITDPLTGETHFEPEPFSVGPGMTTFVPGLQSEDAEGNRSYVSPSVVYRDPVTTTTFIDSDKHLYANMLHSVHQEHVLLGDEDASGESRKQSRADFEAALNDEQESVRGAMQWMLETVMHMLALLTGQADRFADLKVDVETHVNLGPLSSPEMDTIIKLTESKLLSKRSGRVRLGVRDLDAEERQIAEEEEASGARENAALAEALMRNRDRMIAGEGEGDGETMDNMVTDGTEQSADNANPRRAGVLE